ncbi:MULTISPECIES: iron-containing redox enzyme family protein [unclassified Microbacterium]|uniref:iron-containing redox enzyme family protein n=1 Tax=unclassified Microbacterium TaxID=2609290 RepID=UPI000EA975FE|nr:MULTISPECIES: iron-containing redox enzyme family protein [unclassified Microbacterium]MBT2483475.1 iron-containing redox enzyme family protein [Microbacterium sp. ISL-108]RKN66494.1 iron-containing redox enzyme family protein [Microbacterium sp. CGR2]
MTASALVSDTLVPFRARGSLSDAILTRLRGDGDDSDHSALAADAVAASSDILRDDDIQLALFLLYASAYGSLPQLDAELEWDPELIATRRILEDAFERTLRDVVPMPDLPEPTVDAVGRALFALAAADTGPSLSRYIAKKATKEQAEEMLILRSVYTLREADPHSWAIPRLEGRAKAALVEIQSDEYGGGRPHRVHQEIFAAAMRAAGLDSTYGVYVDDVPAISLASFNMMSLFGLNRRLVGAIVGHLAAYEMTSSIPCRLYADGLRRLGFHEDVADYFAEHVEADAVHEQIAGRDLAGSLAEDHPELLSDIMFGASACLLVDGWVGGHILDAWSAGFSALRQEAAS